MSDTDTYMRDAQVAYWTLLIDDRERLIERMQGQIDDLKRRIAEHEDGHA